MPYPVPQPVQSLRGWLSPWLSPLRPQRERKRRGELRTLYPSFPRPGRSSKRKRVKSSFSSGLPHNEAVLFAMMKLMAAKHGWSVEDQARQFGPDALASSLLSAPPPPTPLAPPTPAYPGTGLISRAPAALGDPPGEESFTLPMGPPPPPDRERDYVVSFARFRLVPSPRIVRHGRGRVVGYLHGPRPL